MVAGGEHCQFRAAIEVLVPYSTSTNRSRPARLRTPRQPRVLARCRAEAQLVRVTAPGDNKIGVVSALKMRPPGPAALGLRDRDAPR